eukprot:5453247-Prymnesium_polylepis.2
MPKPPAATCALVPSSSAHAPHCTLTAACPCERLHPAIPSRHAFADAFIVCWATPISAETDEKNTHASNATHKQAA